MIIIHVLALHVVNLLEIILKVFKGSGSDYESFTCLKCEKQQSVANYYKCNKCNGIFCSQCPFNNNNKIRN